MRFFPEWFLATDSASPELCATAAALAIEISNTRVTQYVDRRDGLSQERVVVPTYPMAEGLARSWWTLIAGRTHTIRLRRFREGFAVPDICFDPDGVQVHVAAYPYTYDNPPVSFYAAAHEYISIAEFERDVRVFIEATLSQCANAGLPSTALAERWTLIRASQEDAEETAFCEAAGALGIDPYTCTDAQAEAIHDAATMFEGPALAEFLAGQTSDNIRTELSWLERNEGKLATRAALSNLESWASKARRMISFPPPRYAPWRVGYDAAKAVRSVHGIGEDRIFDSVSVLGELCENSRFEIASDRVRDLRACLSRCEGTLTAIVGRSASPNTNVFTLARAIGDYVTFGSPNRSPITNAVSSYRQATGRAFAAELLAPAAEVVARTNDGESIEDIAATRKVDALVIEHQLQNQSHRFANVV